MRIFVLIVALFPFVAMAQPIPGSSSSGGATQYDEDSAHTSGEKLMMCGTVRRDTAASGVGADGDRATLNVDSSGRVWVNGSGVTQPVSGTVTCNAGTGTLTVDSELPTAQTVTDNITGFGSAPHVMGATMIYNGTGWDRARGDTANGIDVDVTRVSGSVTVTDGSGNLTVDGTVTANQGGTWNITNVSGTVSLPTGAATSALQTTGNTSLSTIAGAVSGTEMQVDVVTLPSVSGTVTCNAGTNLNTSALATESTLSTLNGKVTACNTGAVTISSALPAGTNTIGRARLIDSGGTEAKVVAGSTSAVISDPGLVVAVSPMNNTVRLRPDIEGGLSVERFLDLDETDVAVKASRGQLYGYFLFNAANSTRFFKLYNAATSGVTVGTTTPVITIPVPAGSAANVEFTQGIYFSTAITAACTTGIADSDTGAPGANECVANFFFN